MQTAKLSDLRGAGVRINSDIGLLMTTAGVRDRSKNKIQRRAVRTGDLIQADRRTANETGHDPKDPLLFPRTAPRISGANGISDRRTPNEVGCRNR